MVFEGADVPLTEDILKKPRDFFPTFLEWVADGNAEQIIRARTSDGDIYKVPENFTLFVTSAFLAAVYEGVGATHFTAALSREAGDLTLLSGEGDHSAGGVTAINQTISYPMPIKFEAGQVIEVAGSSDVSVRAGIFGFILPKKISIR